MSGWMNLVKWLNPLNYLSSRPASPPAAARQHSALKGATSYPTTTIAERLSYVTVIISCHGADMVKTVTLPRDVSVRKLSLSGKCGVLMWGFAARLQGQEKEPIETIIFDEFSKFRDHWTETHSSGSVESVNHAQMLDEFSAYLKGSGIPQGLQDTYHLAKSRRVLPRNIAPTLDDWISYTDANIEHSYSFYGEGKTESAKAVNCAPFGIWLVDSSEPSFTAKIRSSSKLNSLEDIMNSKNIYREVKSLYEDRVKKGEKKLRITLSDLVSILSQRYSVKNVNIIDTSCRYLPEGNDFADVSGECPASHCLSPPSLDKLTAAAGQTVSKHNRGGGKICNTTRKNKHRNKNKNKYKYKNKNKGSLNCRSRAHFITRRQRRSRTSGSKRH